MIFEEIRIHNLFSYRNERIVLPAPTQERSVVIISGRNGYGKTSFINSLKLLFLGTSDEMLNTVQPGNKLRPNTYLLGKGNEWRGVFNLNARSHGEIEFGISIRWREAEGCVTASRKWELRNNEPEQKLLIETDFETDQGRRIRDPEECEAFLERRLPKNLVPFFIYDGEQVQELAEDNQKGKLEKIERLLDLAVIDTLDTFLQAAMREWRQEGSAPQEQAHLDKLQAELKLKEATYQEKSTQKDDLAVELDDNRRNQRRVQQQINRIQILVHQQNEEHLRQRVNELSAELENACLELAQALPPAAPLWANPVLVDRVTHELGTLVNNPNQLLADEMRVILERLPGRLFDEPPHSTPRLTDAQKAHYQKKAQAIFQQYLDVSVHNQGSFALTNQKASALQRRFDYFQQAHEQRRRFASDLRAISQKRRELQQAQHELNAVDNATPEEQEAFHRYQAELQQLETERDLLSKTLGEIEAELSRLQPEIEDVKRKIKRQETRLVHASIATDRIERARQAQRLFEVYKQELKKRRIEQVEHEINHCFKQLMTSHTQVARIVVEENFALRYLDKNDDTIGMANISSGMKQLVAQALLWALSRAAGKPVPVVIDTPLARIDRGHQENLLLNYYPQAAKQTIILPTDSELDLAKYQLLQPYLSAEFRLENPTGDDTRIRQAAMYPTALAS